MLIKFKVASWTHRSAAGETRIMECRVVVLLPLLGVLVVANWARCADLRGASLSSGRAGIVQHGCWLLRAAQTRGALHLRGGSAAQAKGMESGSFEVHYRCSRKWKRAFVHYSWDEGATWSLKPFGPAGGDVEQASHVGVDAPLTSSPAGVRWKCFTVSASAPTLCFVLHDGDGTWDSVRSLPALCPAPAAPCCLAFLVRAQARYRQRQECQGAGCKISEGGRNCT